MPEMKGVSAVEHREEVKREPKSVEAPREEPRPRRFRIVKLEERTAPRASVPNTQRVGCAVCTYPDSGCD
jgi:hypothetical protein